MDTLNSAAYKRAGLFFSLVLLFELALIFLPPFPGRFILKLLPGGVLLWQASKLQGRNRIFMMIALLFCMLGDTFLDIDRNRLFIGGLVSFLTGHLVYAVYFFLGVSKPSRRGIAAIAGFVLFGLVFGWILGGIPMDLRIPVWIYLAVIIVMAVAAVLRQPQSVLLQWGAVVFILSDTIIAVNKFLIPIPMGTPLNIFIYFTAQYLIVAGVVGIPQRAAV